MVSHALMTPALSDAGTAPTYGELIGLARQRAQEAIGNGCGPFSSAVAAAAEVTGFERYLAVAGRHLRLVASPGLAPTSGHTSSMPVLQQLIQRMTGLDLTRPAGSTWGRAADALATAHDLMATHLGAYGETRTPEGQLLADPRIRRTAVATVLGLVEEPLRARHDLLAAASAAPRAASPAVMTRSVSAHVRQATNAIADLVDECITTSAGRQGELGQLGDLTPALPTVTGASRPPRFQDALHALRVLRLLSYRQTSGTEPASPASLHDLAHLAATVSAGPDRWLAPPENSLARVQRATALDQLEAASDAWATTSTALGQHIRGLSRAPRVYADAIRVVEAAREGHAVRRAVLATLPRLGRDAADTTTQLARAGCLATATREAGKPQALWRLLRPEDAEVLAARFSRASRASEAAWTAITRLDHATGTRESRCGEPAARRDVSRSLSRGVS